MGKINLKERTAKLPIICKDINVAPARECCIISVMSLKGTVEQSRPSVCCGPRASVALATALPSLSYPSLTIATDHTNSVTHTYIPREGATSLTILYL